MQKQVKINYKTQKLSEHAGLLDRVIEDHAIRQAAARAIRTIRRRKRIITEEYVTLHEAIFRGAARRKQTFGKFERARSGAVCALGAAAVGIGAKESDEYQLAYMFNGIKVKAGCPANKEKCSAQDGLDSILIHLNDKHRWSLRKIARWVQKEFPKVITKKKVQIVKYEFVEEEVKA